MKSLTKNAVFEGERIYTLGHNRTLDNTIPPVIIHGNGSKPRNRADLQNKAGKKYLTQKLMLALVKVAESNNDESLRRSFWNTYHCHDTIVTHDRKTFGKYCKNRYCTICLGIRKAEMINRYLPVLKKWEEPQLVTITVRSIPAYRLAFIVKAMNRAFRLIKDRNRKRHSRGKGLKLVGIKSLECNFNPTRRTYNPHFHLIVPNIDVAEQLVKEWLEIWTPKYNLPIGQDIRPIRNLESGMVEVIKYSTKVFTDPDPNNVNRKKASPKVYIRAMYNIISTLKGERIFERFGFNVPKSNSQSDKNPREIKEYDSWLYNSEYSDWFSEFSGEALANYIADPSGDENLLNNLDTDLE